MKAKLNNTRLMHHYNLTNVSQCLFVQKWNELFFPKTINTYQFKLRNTHYILKEALEVLKLIKTEGISRANLHDLILECKKQLTNDPVITKYYRDVLGHLVKVLKTNISNEPESLQLEFRLNNAIRILSGNYKGKILLELDNALTNNLKEDIEKLTDLLAAELVNEGWSPKSLNLLFKKLFLRNKKAFQQKWAEFVTEINGTIGLFHCYFLLDVRNISDSERAQYFAHLKSVGLNVVDGQQLLGSFSNHNSHINKNSYYIEETAEGYQQDSNGVINKCIYQVAVKQAILSYFDINLYIVENEIFVIHPDEAKVEKPNNPSIENSFEEVNEEKIQAVRDFLIKDDFNSRDKQRLNNFFRQYDLSIKSSSVETRYSNLWSSLESLLMTGHYANNIDHLKKLVPAVMCSRYVRRLLKNFLYDCQRAGVVAKRQGKKIDIEIDEEDAIYQTWLLLTTNDGDQIQFLLSLNDYTLLEQRAKSLIQDIKNSDSLNKLLSNHYNTISWHIQRLYRARNSLVHSATTQKDLDLLLSHLHFYIRSTIHELLFRLEKHNFNSLGELYLAIEDNYIILIDSLNLDSKSKAMYSFETIFTGPVFIK